DRPIPIPPPFPYTTLFRSETSAVERLYNLYKGKRCFILTDGATLSKGDADQLADEFTFGTEIVETGMGSAPFVPSFLVVDGAPRSEEHTSELQSRENLVCR